MIRHDRFAISLLLVLATTTPALADTEPHPDGSMFEPGSLETGAVAVRGGVSMANGPFGIGAQLGVGLGPVEIYGGAAMLPGLFGSSATYYGSGGLQLGLLDAADHHFRLGARAALDVDTRGFDELYLAHGALTATVGPILRRGPYTVNLLVEAIAGRYHERDFEDEHDGYFAGGTGGFEVRRGRVAGLLMLGAAAPLSGQEMLTLGTVGVSIGFGD